MLKITFIFVSFLTASVNSGPSNTYVCSLYFSPKSLENAFTGGQNAKRIFVLSFFYLSLLWCISFNVFLSLCTLIHKIGRNGIPYQVYFRYGDPLFFYS